MSGHTGNIGIGSNIGIGRYKQKQKEQNYWIGFAKVNTSFKRPQ